MKISEKLQICLLAISLFFTTGFFGGEEPQDAVAEIIQAIENNDEVLFAQRVPKPYWETVLLLVQDKNIDKQNLFFRDLNNDKKHNNTMSEYFRSEDDMYTALGKETFYSVIQSYIGKRVASGDLANLSRGASLGLLPFAPEILEVLKFGEEGSGELANIVPAEFGLQNGQRSSLAFAKIDDKWYLLGQGGNNKAAMDMAAKNKKKVFNELQKIVKRKEAMELYKKEFYPQIEDFSRFMAEKNYEEAAKIYTKMWTIFRSEGIHGIRADNDSTLESDELWQAIQENMITNASKINFIRNDIEDKIAIMEKNPKFGIRNQSFLEFEEMLWKEDDMCIIKLTHIDKEGKLYSEEDKLLLKSKWENFEPTPEQQGEIFLYHKKDGIWTTVASALFLERNGNKKFALSYPLANISSMKNFTPEEFLLAYAKRYKAMDAKVQEHIAKQEEWKKSLFADMKTINEALQKGDVERLIPHLDMLMMESDNGNLETDPKVYIKKKEELTNIWEALKKPLPEGTKPVLNLDNIEVVRIFEHSAVLKKADGLYLYAIRKDLNSPWRFVRHARSEQALKRPANWEENFAKRVKLLEDKQAAEDKIKQEIKDTLYTLIQASKDKNIALTLKHSNLISLISDDGELEDFAQRIVKAKSYNIKEIALELFNELNVLEKDLSKANSIELELYAALTNIEKIDFIKITEHVVIVKYDKIYALVERVDANSPWVLMRAIRGETEANLLRPPNWMEDVNKRVAEIEATIAQEVKRKAEIMAVVEPQLRKNFALMAKAIQDKKLDDLSNYVDFTALSFPVSHGIRQTTHELATKVSPDFRLKRTVSEIFQGKKNLESLDSFAPYLKILWDKEAWEKASIEFFPDTEKEDWERAGIEFFPDKHNVFIVSLSSKTSDKESSPFYALIVQNEDAKFKLIDLTKNKHSLTLFGNKILIRWDQLFRNYTPSQAKLAIVKLAHLLADKNGAEAIKFFNFDDLSYWIYDRQSENINKQAYANLFPETSQNNIENKNSLASKTLNEINTNGKALALSAQDLADAVFTPGKTDNAFSLTTPQGALAVVKSDENFLIRQLYKSSQQNGYRYFTTGITNSFANRQKSIAKEQLSLEKKFASATLAKTMLDFVKIENAQFTIKQNGGKMVLISSFTARNTFSAPIKISQFCYYFQDKNGVNWKMGSFSSRSSNTIAPKNAIKVEDTSHLNAQELYLVEAFKKGEVILLVRPRIIQVDKTYFQLNDTGLKVTKNADGTWEMTGFPAVKMRETWKDPNRKEQNAFNKRFEEAKKQNEIKSMEYAEKIIASVPIRYDSDKKSVVITNPFNFDISFNFSMERLDGQDVILADATRSGNIKANQEVVYKMEDLSRTKKAIPNDTDTLNLQITSLAYQDLNLQRNEEATIHGFVPPVLYQESPVLFQLTKEEAETFKDRTKIDTTSEKKTEEVKESTLISEASVTQENSSAKDSQGAEADTEQPKITQEKEAVTINKNLIAPEPKKPGTAVLLSTTLDKVGLKEIKEDGEKDSHIQVLTKGASPLVAIRLETIGGKAGSWKSKDAKADAMGVILLMHGEKILNPNNASFEIDVTKPLVLDLFVQDNGALNDSKNRIRVTFFHKDGSRSYAIVKK